jgi:hypothetical protein
MEIDIILFPAAHVPERGKRQSKFKKKISLDKSPQQPGRERDNDPISAE